MTCRRLGRFWRFGSRPLRFSAASALGRSSPQPLRSPATPPLWYPHVWNSALSGDQPLSGYLVPSSALPGPLRSSVAPVLSAWCPRSSASAFGPWPLWSLPVPVLASVPRSTDSGQALGHFEIRHSTDLARGDKCCARSTISGLVLRHSALVLSGNQPWRSLPINSSSHPWHSALGCSGTPALQSTQGYPPLNCSASGFGQDTFALGTRPLRSSSLSSAQLLRCLTTQTLPLQHPLGLPVYRSDTPAHGAWLSRLLAALAMDLFSALLFRLLVAQVFGHSATQPFRRSGALPPHHSVSLAPRTQPPRD